MEPITLKAARVNKNLTLEDLSRITGISRPTLIKYESGKVSPKWENLKRIIEVLGVNVDQLKL